MLLPEDRERAIRLLGELKWLQSKILGGVDPIMLQATATLNLQLRLALVDDEAMRLHLTRVISTPEPTQSNIAKPSSRRRRKV